MDKKTQFRCPECDGPVVDRHQMGPGDAVAASIFGLIALAVSFVMLLLGESFSRRLVCKSCERRWMKKYSRETDGTRRVELVAWRQIKPGRQR